MKAHPICLLAAILLAAAEPDTTRFGPQGSFRLEYRQDSFGMRAYGVIESGTKTYPLPQSTVDTYIRLRPADVKLNPISATAGQYERQEVIGPHQVVGGKLWFGNHFYDGEGSRGVGAFGYFDTSTRRYQLFSPPEVAPYEVSAILVEDDAVWVALDHFGEDISTTPGGLIQWNRNTQKIQRYPIEFVVSDISREKESLRLETDAGFAMLTKNVIHRFQIVTDSHGIRDSTPVARFPPPPSKQ